MSIRELRQWAWYTTFPTLYVDEDSVSSELLWQQVLEQRALRATIWVTAVLAPVLFAALVVVGVVLFR
jgi:hypothetical protein